MSFTIKSVKLVSNWRYDLPAKSNVDCTICRSSLNSSSLYNIDKGIDSVIVSGGCGHSFHMECIQPWLVNNNRCAICSEEWIQTKKY